MSIDHCIVAALIALATGLWVRRTTWAFKWESAATINLAGILICLVCMLPPATPAFDWLYEVTGIWNLEDLIGHLAYLSGITVLAYVTLNRIELADATRWRRFRLELPGTIILPTLAGLFAVGSPHRHVRDLFTEPSGLWMACYWVLMQGAAAWVLAHLLWALVVIIRWDPESATMAKIYLIAVGVDLGSLITKVLSLWVHGVGLEMAAWMLVVVSTVGYAAAAIYGMRGVRRRLAWPPPRADPPPPPAAQSYPTPPRGEPRAPG